MPDLFFDLFVKEFEQIKNKIEHSGNGKHVGSLLSKILQAVKVDDVWRRLTTLSRRQDYLIAAVDGGVRTIPFSDGSEIVISRAISVNNFGLQPVRTVYTQYLPVPSNAAYWTYLSLAELDTAIRCVEEQLSKFESKDRYLLIDGSLYARLTGTIHNLILTRGFLDLYYVPEIITSLIRLCQLLELCRELNVQLVFVSKNSSLKILKDHIIFTTLKELVREEQPLNMSNDLFEIFTKGAEWYSIVWLRKYRKKLVELAGKYNGTNREIIRTGIRIVISQSITDTCILEHLAQMCRLNMGISRKLLLGVVDAYMNDRKLTNMESLLKMIQDRIEDSIMLRMVDDKEAESCRKLAQEVRRYIEKIPRILLTYVKFSRDDVPILIEIPVYKWRFFDDTIPPKIFYDSYNMWDVLEVLYSEYKGPYHYNRMLWLAHEYATFRDSEYYEYVVAAMRSLKCVRGRRIHTLLIGPQGGHGE